MTDEAAGVVACKHLGCERPTKVKSTGYCNAHYQRMMTGRPMDAPIRFKPTKGMTPYDIVMARSVDRDNGCREWTGPLSADKKDPRPLVFGEVAARVVLEHHLGPSDLWALHSCDNGICVNIAHLRWDAPQGNRDDAVSRDRHARGEAQAGAKLTDEQVLAIRADGRHGVDIAAEYGVSKAVISAIRTGRRWKHLSVDAVPYSKRNGRRSEEDIRAIRTAEGRSADIAERFGISVSMVSMIKNRKAYAWVQD